MLPKIKRILEIVLTYLSTGRISTARRNITGREHIESLLSDSSDCNSSSSSDSSLSDSSSPDSSPVLKPTKVRKRALCIAINNYPGTANDLRGCINDAILWENLLKDKYHFESVSRLFDREATRKNVKKAMKDIVNSSVAGDVLAITFSGHGTSIIDKDGDEANGRDEALCLYDGLMIDDEIREIMDVIPHGIRVTIVVDSCFSGTITRLEEEDSSQWIEPRYMPPSDSSIVTDLMMAKRKKEIFRSSKQEEDMNEVLITGCSDSEQSYDAFLGGNHYGAMSFYANQILNKDPNITYIDFHKKLRKILPSARLPQSPQLEGRLFNKDSLMFA
jgi:metacaspase-1